MMSSILTSDQVYDGGGTATPDGVVGDNNGTFSSGDTMCMLDDGDTAFMMFAATVVMMQTPAMGLA